MEKARREIEIKHYVRCPHCGKRAGSIGHLLAEKRNTTFGSWDCESCGNNYRGKIEDGDVFVEKAEGRTDKILVFLIYKRCMIAVQSWTRDGIIDFDHLNYYFTEHTCPTNFMRTELCIEFGEDGEIDLDPHGIFDFVTAIPYPEEMPTNITVEHLREMGVDLSKLKDILNL